MLLQCDMSIADRYTSQTQKSRILSEAWFQRNGYCLACENDQLLATSANTKATDFVCEVCNQNYELKSFRVRPKRTLLDGAYGSFMARILNGSVPTMMMLERDEKWEIQSLTAIHHLFLTPDVIVQRKPLSQTARRAGWIGCNIRLDRIALDAQLELLQDGHATEHKLIRERYRKFSGLKQIEPAARGWATLTLQTIRTLGRDMFSLDMLYAKEAFFASVYPHNKNIRAKVRQQLQILRHLGYVEFSGRGTYRMLI